MVVNARTGYLEWMRDEFEWAVPMALGAAFVACGLYEPNTATATRLLISGCNEICRDRNWVSVESGIAMLDLLTTWFEARGRELRPMMMTAAGHLRVRLIALNMVQRPGTGMISWIDEGYRRTRTVCMHDRVTIS